MWPCGLRAVNEFGVTIRHKGVGRLRSGRRSLHGSNGDMLCICGHPREAHILGGDGICCRPECACRRFVGDEVRALANHVAQLAIIVGALSERLDAIEAWQQRQESDK